MKFDRFRVLTAILVLQIVNATSSEADPLASPYPGQIEDVSILQPGDIAYAEAMEFGRFLSAHGLTVESLHRSKLESMFRRVEKAAFIKTDKGIVQVVFFPAPADAEKIKITYSKNVAETVPHKYVIEQPITADSQTIESAYPMYFTLHINWFIETSECGLDAILKRSLGQDNRQKHQQ